MTFTLGPSILGKLDCFSESSTFFQQSDLPASPLASLLSFPKLTRRTGLQREVLNRRAYRHTKEEQPRCVERYNHLEDPCIRTRLHEDRRKSTHTQTLTNCRPSCRPGSLESGHSASAASGLPAEARLPTDALSSQRHPCRLRMTQALGPVNCTASSLASKDHVNT